MRDEAGAVASARGLQFPGRRGNVAEQIWRDTSHIGGGLRGIQRVAEATRRICGNDAAMWIHRGKSNLKLERSPYMRFRSKIDTWLAVLVAGAAVASLLASVSLLRSGASGALLIVAFTTLLTLGLPIWLLAATHYSFDDNVLRIQGGPFRWTVPIDQIQSVRASRALWSSPALSLDRLRIDYGKGRWILISPADKEGFLGELSARRSNNSLERSRDR